MREWTGADSELAQADGWDLFRCFGGELDGKYSVQRLDSPECGDVAKFDSDESALAHVRRRANSGDELCVRARDFHLTEFMPKKIQKRRAR